MTDVDVLADLEHLVGRGWHPIVLRLHAALWKIHPGYKVLQVKEKFGGLRFYAASSKYGPLSSTADMLVRDAEAESSRTCQECGATGSLHKTDGGWLLTLCPSCAQQRSASPV